MDNASKALIIAGGVLLAVLILGTFMYMWTLAGSYTSQIEDEKEKEQITAFNMQYEAYQRQILRGNDIASVINKIRDNNRKNADNVELQIKWEFTLKRGIIGVLTSGTYNESKSSVYDNILNDPTTFRDFKNLYFKCSSIEYSKTTCKVNKITFNEILYEELFDE